MRYHDPDDQPYIVIEKHSGGVGNLLLGVVIGAGVALLFAPRSGVWQSAHAWLRSPTRR